MNTGTNAMRNVLVRIPAIAGAHCTYPWRDGQAELTYIIYNNIIMAMSR